MAGHSKWAKIKHKKAVTDAKKSKEFSKLARLIASESKRVGGDSDAPSLRAVIEKARAANMPKENIERAIEKGRMGGGTDMEQITFELYGPGGCAIMVDALTDNRNRTNQEVKHILAQMGYTLAAPGSAAWAFTREGGQWRTRTTVTLEENDLIKLSYLIDALEAQEDVQVVVVNVA